MTCLKVKETKKDPRIPKSYDRNPKKYKETNSEVEETKSDVKENPDLAKRFHQSGLCFHFERHKPWYVERAKFHVQTVLPLCREQISILAPFGNQRIARKLMYSEE